EYLTMPRCSTCSLDLTSIKALITHISVNHSDELNKYDCGERGCNSRFDILNSYHKHLRVAHKFPSQPPSINNIHHSTLTRNETILSNRIENELETGTNNISCNETCENFESGDINTVNFKFVAKLYANPRLPRNIVQTIVEDTHIFIGDKFLRLLESSVDIILSKLNCPSDDHNKIKSIYMSSLKSDTTVIENFIQGKLWAEKRSKYSDNDIVIPYFFAGDDVEVNNPLSSHSSKVMPIYASFPCLPPECSEKLEIALMIFTVRLYNELNVWKKNSYETSLSTGEKVYFVLDLIQGDNLGWHGLLGFTESAKKNDCKNALIIPCELKQNNVNYDTTMSYTKNYDVFIVIFRTIFFPCTDMKEKCVFNKIESFHCTKNYSVDGMHDVREGIAHDDLITNLRKLKGSVFDYGPIDCSNIL
ncbi:Protein of unknown function, partial [Cotesia congregata]